MHPNNLPAAENTGAASSITDATSAHIPPEIAARIKATGRAIAIEQNDWYAPMHAGNADLPITVTRDIRYGPAERNVADLYMPQQQSDAPRKVLIFLHGGGYIRGDKRDIENVGYWAAMSDMVGVLINYPLAPQNGWPSGAWDLGVAVQWLKQNAAIYGVEPNAIFIMGASAGASHVAAYVSHNDLQPTGKPDVAGAILASGVYDVTAVPGPAPLVEAYYGIDRTLYSDRSATAGLQANHTPLLISYAQYDDPLFESQALALGAALAEAGRPHNFLMVAGHAHISQIAAIGTPDASLTDPILAFINAH